MSPYACTNRWVISITKGSTYKDYVTILDVDGNVFDLTGLTVNSQIRTLSGVLAGTFTCIVSNPTSGGINRILDKNTTELLTPALDVRHVWGIEVTALDGTVYPEIQGGVIVLDEVVK